MKRLMLCAWIFFAMPHTTRPEPLTLSDHLEKPVKTATLAFSLPIFACAAAINLAQFRDYAKEHSSRHELYSQAGILAQKTALVTILFGAMGFVVGTIHGAFNYVTDSEE